jgi:hypothetical protein
MDTFRLGHLRNSIVSMCHDTSVWPVHLSWSRIRGTENACLDCDDSLNLQFFWIAQADPPRSTVKADGALAGLAQLLHGLHNFFPLLKFDHWSKV